VALPEVAEQRWSLCTGTTAAREMRRSGTEMGLVVRDRIADLFCLGRFGSARVSCMRG
jgi:hypothetical protein